MLEARLATATHEEFPMRWMWTLVAAGQLVVSVTGRATTQDLLLATGAQTRGGIVARIIVKLNRQVATRELANYSLILFRSTHESTVLTTDDRGRITMVVPAGEYRLASAAPATSGSGQYTWNVPLRVHPGMKILELTANNAVGAPVVVAVQAQGSAPTFGGVEWGSSEAQVRAALTGKGYTLEKIDNDGDLDFKGDVGGRPAVLFAFMTPTRSLVKIQINIVTPDHEARSTFDDMKQTLTAKYGRPRDDFHFFSSPYVEGDGFEETAFRVGKGHFFVAWADTNDTGALDMEITERLTVAISYESPAWHEEAARRKSQSTKDF
jgi:hypothetical protein